LDMTLEVQPNKGLGPFALGSSAYEVISYLRKESSIYTKIALTYSSTTPLTSNLIVNLPNNGIRLRFDGPEQRLRLIEILDFQKARPTYKSTFGLVELSRGDGPPNFKKIYNNIFGATYEGEHLPSQSLYVLSYPGVAFSFPLNQWSNDINIAAFLSSSTPLTAASMAIYSGESWTDARDNLFTGPIPTAYLASTPDEIDLVKILPSKHVEFHRRNHPPFVLNLGQTTPQDIVTELGPPSAIYRKNDHRISIHRTRGAAGGNEDDFSDDAESEEESSDGAVPTNEATDNDYFYNYFSQGFDIFFSSTSTRQHVATKLILHGNVPGSYSFQRYRRSKWIVQDPAYTINSETDFPEIRTALQSSFGDGQKPMLLNRGSDSPSSSIELLGSWEDSETRMLGKMEGVEEEDEGTNYGSTELYGYPGLIFEVLKNGAVVGVTVF
ncbi:UPF0183-domain-containing protein, partial [Ascobolus immersus RN42]